MINAVNAANWAQILQNAMQGARLTPGDIGGRDPALIQAAAQAVVNEFATILRAQYVDQVIAAVRARPAPAGRMARPGALEADVHNGFKAILQKATEFAKNAIGSKLSQVHAPAVTPAGARP
jgi:hypothetical protein